MNFYALQITNSINRNKDKLELELDKISNGKENNMKTVACYVVNPTRSPFKNDQYDSFRSEGRIPINIGFGLSLMGFKVNIIFNEWDIKGGKDVYPNVYLSNLPLHRHYDYVLTWTLSGLDQITFDKLIFMDWCFMYYKNVIDYTNLTKRNIIYTLNSIYMVKEKEHMNMTLENNYFPGLYPIPSTSVGFIKYNFNVNTLELKLYIYYNPSRNSERYLQKQQLIIDFFKKKGYKIKLNIHTDKCSSIIPFKEEMSCIYDNESRYIDVINFINSSDICILSGSSTMTSSLYESVSQGKPILYISDSVVQNNGLFINRLFEYPEDLIYTVENNDKSVLKLENFISNIREITDKYKELFKDTDFNNWKEIAKKFFVI